MDISRLGAQLSGLWNQVVGVAVDLVAEKTPTGGLKLRDEVPDVVDQTLQFFGAPELPAADKAMAMEGLEGLLALLTAENTEAQIKAASALAQKLLPGVISKVAEEVGKHAGNNFVGDLAQGMLKWIGQNPSQAALLAADIGRVIATAITTGGTSLVADVPALLPKLVAASSGVLQASGITPEKLLGNIATDLLKFLGVNEVDAQTWGEATGSLMALGADVALAVATNGQHKINPQLVQAAVSHVATAVGAPPDTATLIATSAAMAFTLGQNFAGFVLSGQPPETFGGFDKVFKNAGEVAQEAVKLFLGQEGASIEQIARKLKDLKPLFDGFVQTLSTESSAANPQYGNVGWDAFFQNLQQVLATSSSSQVVTA